ncbi:uncharacterized protein AMSG_08963 [Thecamonas trahens ATCC 50062]|uniref:Uncharacterized protein n=1 Tax=Thecamonas trahens ATCC 50062 TaxID=461836 RepID=A0A0L0DN31_THETB|nr:hypothetical protein AMSG_08963 [Thecamonas trahens ATCC 50062]KNC52823.1 hypothetical protein AMSG_08963 [Thecamonas trahens ATCC 50062]|eukprot:XP_013754929.1 hypothetical protein AMSG_08963 [Thecamonas trahens ATCC 50062]
MCADDVVDLFRATRTGNIEQVKWLVSYGQVQLMPSADEVAAAAAGSEAVDSILHAAAASGSLDVLAYIHSLLSGADTAHEVEEAEDNGVWEALVDSFDSSGSTPLMHAVRGGVVDMISFLLGAGAGVSVAGVGGKTPLHVALENGSGLADSKVLEVLIEGGADFDAADDKGVVPSAFRVVQRLNRVALVLEDRRAVAAEEAARVEALEERRRRRIEQQALVNASTRAALGRARAQAQKEADARNAAKRVVELSMDDMLAKEMTLGSLYADLPAAYVPASGRKKRRGKKSQRGRGRGSPGKRR